MTKVNYRWLLLQIPGKFTQDLHCRNCNCWCFLLRSKVFKLTGHSSVFFNKFVVMGSAVANKRNLWRIPHLSVNPDISKVLYLSHGVVPLLPNPGGWGSVGGDVLAICTDTLENIWSTTFWAWQTIMIYSPVLNIKSNKAIRDLFPLWENLSQSTICPMNYSRS